MWCAIATSASLSVDLLPCFCVSREQSRQSEALALASRCAHTNHGTRTPSLQTALHLASLSGQGELAGALVQRGASIVRRDGNGNTCLHLAKDAGVTRAVLRAAAAEDARKAMEVRNDQGYTALHVAAIQGRLDIALELVARHGADVNAQDDSTGRTALHHAVRAGSRPVCELLLEFMADVNAQDSAGNTPLHAAVQFDRFDITKLLVDFGADCVANNAYFQTPLDLAMHYGSTEASRAMSIFPSIRIPNRSLDAVAAAVFPGLAAKARTAPAPASAQPAVVPPASSATVQQQHTVPVRAHRQGGCLGSVFVCARVSWCAF